MKKVVVIGGGNGSSIVLRALKPSVEELDISAVISVADSGRTSGRIREEFAMIPPSDCMRAILALSRYDYHTLRDIFFTNRIKEPRTLEGHNLGSLFLAWSTRALGGDVVASMRALEGLLGAVGTVYPATTQQVDLMIELSDGTIVRGEGAIDEPTYDRSLATTRVWLEPEGEILPEARTAFTEADTIVIAPSSVYTSILSTLLVGGVRDAINQSAATILYTPQTFLDHKGEVCPTTLSDQIQVIERFLPRPISAIIYNTDTSLDRLDQKYGTGRYGVLKKDVENVSGRRMIGENLFHPIDRMDIEHLGRLLHQIIEDQS